jgi:outer membrane protein OmpA-like peptidoglycan-associated protein
MDFFTKYKHSALLLLLSGILCGCASSSVSRGAASQVDAAYENSNSILTHAGDNDPADAYQNAPQTTKGAIIGATAGGVVGAIGAGTVGILPGLAGGAALGGVLGAYIDYHTTIIDQLENRGVKVVTLGDQIMIVWPSEQIFTGMTSKITYQAYTTLELIARYINLYTSMLVKVAAYTNDTGDSQVNCVVSQQQANAVEKYLWKHVNARIITAQGYGGTHLLERNNMAWGQGMNYRIEIILEKLPT